MIKPIVLCFILSGNTSTVKGFSAPYLPVISDNAKFVLIATVHSFIKCPEQCFC